MNKKTLLIAGGGTGGHVLAGIAVADAWRAKWGEQASVLFVGAHGGMEEKLVPKAGYPLQLLHLGSLNKVSTQRRLKTLFQLPFSLLTSLWIVFRTRPQFVLGVGGYASGPIVLIAQVLGRLKLISAKNGVLEQNVIPGFTNRMLGKFADNVFVAFPGTELHFPSSRVILTGNPTRSSMKPMASAPANPFTIFIFGGSQGAMGINSLVLQALPHLKDLKDRLKWVHQTGEKDFERVQQEYIRQDISARVEKFIFDMAAVYQQSNLLICRAGSSTLSEVAAVGRASILIPLPTAADNHQEANAKSFVDAQAACLVIQNSSTGESLAQLIRGLISDPDRISQMQQRAQQLYRPQAAEDMVNEMANSPLSRNE